MNCARMCRNHHADLYMAALGQQMAARAETLRESCSISKAHHTGNGASRHCLEGTPHVCVRCCALQCVHRLKPSSGLFATVCDTSKPSCDPRITEATNCRRRQRHPQHQHKQNMVIIMARASDIILKIKVTYISIVRCSPHRYLSVRRAPHSQRTYEDVH